MGSEMCIRDSDNSILYCGYYRDAETHLDCVRFRYRHIYLGWITTEPGGKYRDGMSLYDYALASPATHVDWSGRQASKPSSTITRDPAVDEALRRCRESLNALKKRFSTGQGAVGRFYRCALKRGCIDPKHIDCKYEPTKPWRAWYNSRNNGIYLNAASFRTEATRQQTNWWRVQVHELVHAVDCTTTFATNKRLDRMVREARAYWRMRDKCTCKKACEDAWDSAKYSCYQYEAYEPARNSWSKEWDAWRDANRSKPEQDKSLAPQFNPPDRATWERANRGKWIKACQDNCGKDHLKDRSQVDRECDKILKR